MEYSSDEIKQQTSLNKYKKSVKKWRQEDSHVDCVKFILMLSVSFFSCHTCTKICVLVFYFLFLYFYPTEIERFA